MAIKPRKHTIKGKTYYRVRVNKKREGLFVDESFNRLSEARQFIAKIELGHKLVQTNKTNKTFGDLVRWLEKNRHRIKKKGGEPYSETTLNTNFSRWHFYCKNGFEDIRLSNLDGGRIHLLTSQLAEKFQWEPQTLYRNQSVLSSALKVAVDLGWVSKNAMKDVSDRHNKQVRRNRVVTQDEFDRICHACFEAGYDRLLAWISCMWETGARRGELLQLTWDCVIPLDDDVFGAELVFRAETTKNKQEKRLPITHDTLNKIKKAAVSDEPVFLEGTQYKQWADAKKRAGLSEPDPIYGEKITFHHLRHALATRVAKSGAALDELMAVGGWKTVSQAQRYMHVESQRAKSALARLYQDSGSRS
jgi:integrase